MSARQPRPIDTVISGDVTWRYDRAADKLTRAETAPLTPTSAELARLYTVMGMDKHTQAHTRVLERHGDTFRKLAIFPDPTKP